MQYIELKNHLRDFIVFTQKDIKKIDESFSRQNLNAWQKKGYIKKIIKGHYLFSDIEVNQNILFLIGNKIYKPSYVSFESALSFYKLVPESIFAITSANSRNTYTFKTHYGEFIYKKIKPKLMFGYKTVTNKNYSFNIAEPEKVILDYLYIKPHLKSEDDFEELRIDNEVFFEQINKKKFYSYLERFKNTALTKRAKRLIKYLENA